MKVFLEHISSQRRSDQLGHWTADANRWHNFKSFFPALQFGAEHNLLDARILVIQDDGVEVRLDFPDAAEFGVALSAQAFGPSATLAH